MTLRSTSLLVLSIIAGCGGAPCEDDVCNAGGSPDAGMNDTDSGLSDAAVDPDPDATPPSAPVTLSLATGYQHTCALSTKGVVKCFGVGLSWGALGLEDTSIRGDQPGEMGAALPAVDLGTGRTALAIASGGSRSCALLDDHSIKCWGMNSAGELGLGHVEYRGDRPNTMGDDLERVDLGPGRTAKSIAMGSRHTCAILDNNSVKCWGYNAYGQLGLGDEVSRGGVATQMGANLPTVSLGTGRTAKALSLGDQFTCALLDNNSVKCWGWNAYGQLGLGDKLDRGDAAGEMGNALPAIDFGTGRTVVALASRDSHSCAVLDNGVVKCWGDNVSGELGTGPSGDRGDEPGELGNAWPAVPLGTGRTAIGVAAGAYHSCALLDNRQVKCWGYNAYGNLGLGDTEYRTDLATLGDALPTIDFGTGRSVTALWSSYQHGCVVLDDRSARCWGNGSELGSSRAGWLGLGDASYRGDGPGEMGDALPPVALW